MTEASRLEGVARLEHDTWAIDFHQAMRRLECTFRDHPRAGEAASPNREPVRLGQDPSFAFSPAALERFEAPTPERPGRLRVAFFGLFGPHGPLPHHFTELARERLRSRNDPSLTAFADLFHHRLLLVLHRAWTKSSPTAGEDRPAENAFSRYLEALCGLGDRPEEGAARAPTSSPSSGAVPGRSRLQFAAHFVGSIRNASGLEALVSSYFECRARVHQFMPEWLDLPASERWKLGAGDSSCRLGSTTVPGARVLQPNQRFRLELGPLPRADYLDFLPGSVRLDRLHDLVRSYVGPDLHWDLELTLSPDQCPELRLGTNTRLGYQSWLPARGGARKIAVLVDPRRRAIPQQSPDTASGTGSQHALHS